MYSVVQCYTLARVNPLLQYTRLTESGVCIDHFGIFPVGLVSISSLGQPLGSLFAGLSSDAQELRLLILDLTNKAKDEVRVCSKEQYWSMDVAPQPPSLLVVAIANDRSFDIAA